MADPGSVQLAKAVSRLCGWIYFTSWSLSFYPQPLLNYRRKSTQGALIDFPAINVLGFTFYFLSTTLLFAEPTIRSQYAARNPTSPEPTVRANDVAFAAHAVLLTSITISQWWSWLWGMKQKKGQRPKRYISGVALGCVIGTIWVIAIVGKHGGDIPNDWAWIDVVYAMGYCKLVITVVK
ncbi:MAG: hypothetical protein MMC23_003243 [Stictis urceolatum]|nr:hypothetical protein [Stictis urceolata]